MHSRRGDVSTPAFADGTHISTILNMLLVGDAGNVGGRDPWSAYASHFQPRDHAGIGRWLGQNGFLVFGARGKKPARIQEEIQRQVLGTPSRHVVLTHVNRATGEELPVRSLGQYIKKEGGLDYRVIVDGAMAMGNIDVDLGGLMAGDAGTKSVDYYIGALHKAMGCPTVGVLAFDARTLVDSPGFDQLRKAHVHRNLPVLRGMFDPSLKIQPTTEDAIGLGDLWGALQSIDKKRD